MAVSIPSKISLHFKEEPTVKRAVKRGNGSERGELLTEERGLVEDQTRMRNKNMKGGRLCSNSPVTTAQTK